MSKDIKTKQAREMLKAFSRLNKACTALEGNLKTEIVQLNKSLLERIQSGDPFLKDFCTEIECRFHLGEQETDWQIDAENLVGQVTFHANLFPPYKEQDAAWRYLGDGQDWNPFKSSVWYAFRAERHCYLLSRLIKESDPETIIANIVKIGSITVDLIVSHQHVTELKGKPFKSEKLDWPKIIVKNLL